jgi:DNA-binding CsgD family transcriptional regulator
MHSRVAKKLKQARKADYTRADSNTTAPPNRLDAGFLLLDTTFKPIYVNALATEILFHPEKPGRTKDLAHKLASKIRTMVANGGPGSKVSVCKEFLSGKRHYVCRFFDVQPPGRNTNESSLALLLERSSKATVDVVKICHEYHLTSREGQSVRFLVQGLASKEIAARMKISPNTVKVFLRFAMMKMGVSSRSEMMSKFINRKT